MASHDPSSARNRRRRRPAWSTVALAALAPSVVRAAHPASLRKNARHAPQITKGKGRGDAAHVMVDAAHRPVVPMGSSQNNNPSGGHEQMLAGAAVAAEGAAVLYGAAQDNNAGGSSSRGSVVVVQPENLGGSEAQTADQPQQQSQARGDVQLHPWPHPDTFQADEAGQPKAGTEYYYKNGRVVLEVQGAPAQTSSSDASDNSGKRVDTAYHVAAYNYGRAQGQPNEAEASSKALPSPQEDLDAVAGKQVILRPRLSNEANEADSPAKGAALPPMGSAKEGTGGGGEAEPAVYYYDPQALQSAASASSTNTKTGDAEAAPELTLPAVVYDSSGRALKLEEVHAGGRNEVFLEVQPRAVWADGLASSAAGAVPSQRGFASTSAGSSAASAGGRGQDQYIVLATVATMSLLVGALSAKRLRNRRLLEGCLHPELDDECDDEGGGGSAIIGSATPRYDKKFDAEGAGGEGAAGFGALLGGRRGGGGGYYGTTGDGLHWRGDAEKFDV
ncbi:hypothetical protein ACHAXT_012036 [Thalassiosira profunda]